MAAGLAEASGAGTGVILAARQAEMCTAPIVGPTTVSPCCWLALRMQRVDVHREVEFIPDDLLVLACEFVGTVDAFGVPVCPVQTVLKHGDSKRVWEALANNSFPVPPVEVSPLDDMVLGIHPVHPMPCIVDGQSVGPEEVRVRNDAPIRAIHVGILDAGSVAPVSPVDSALHRMKGNRSGLLQVLPQKHLPVSAIQICYFNSRCPRICPV